MECQKTEIVDKYSLQCKLVRGAALLRKKETQVMCILAPVPHFSVRRFSTTGRICGL